ncbi:MAG: hypothetical protein JWL77_7066 [Chthonomonadaceae bacterium]|nr:hypothetical protein [Chthonomonadaceae bacterium]
MDSQTGFFELVDTLRSAGPELDAHSKIESIEVALVDGACGIVVLWSQDTLDQGVRRFGLVATAEEFKRLALTNDGEFLLSDLHLMLVEPHGTRADEQTRTWFRSVDGFIA